MRFCTYCGQELLDAAIICPKCGCPTPQYAATTAPAQPAGRTQKSAEALKQTVSERYKINGIIWLVIGCLQIIGGLAFNWFLLIVGALNIVSSIQDLNYSKTVLQDTTGIVEKVTPLAGPIISLIYNLVIGGIIGVAGSIYYFIAIRSYVLDNEAAFKQMEVRSTPAYAPQSQNYRPPVRTPDQAPVQKPAPAPAPTQPQQVQIIRCPACGKTQFPGRKTCFNCGGPLITE